MPTVKVSLEQLYHFCCGHCQGWWSIGDFPWPGTGALTCPHCGTVNQLPPSPLLAKDFTP